MHILTCVNTSLNDGRTESLGGFIVFLSNFVIYLFTTKNIIISVKKTARQENLSGCFMTLFIILVSYIWWTGKAFGLRGDGTQALLDNSRLTIRRRQLF